MPDQFTKVTKTGFLSRVGQSIKGIFFGILLFFGSFVLLYWNEGRTDLSNIAKNAVHIDSTTTSADPATDKTLVSLTGDLTSDEVVGDNLYLVPGKYIAVERNVEMYAWVEKSDSTSQKSTGGSETTQTTYNYTKEWTDSPEKSSSFEMPVGHENPELTTTDAENRVSKAKIGEYNLDISAIQLPSAEKLTLTPELLTLNSGNLSASLESGYVYISSGLGTFAAPEVGDIRLSYSVVEPAEVTVFGQRNGTTIETYVEGDATLFRAFTGTPQQALQTMQTEHTTMLWILRVVGFILMWLGLFLIVNPLSVMLDVLPFLGTMTGSLLKLVTGAIAIVLSIVTIVLSFIIHRPIVLIIIIAVLIVIAIAGFMMKKKKK